MIPSLRILLFVASLWVVDAAYPKSTKHGKDSKKYSLLEFEEEISKYVHHFSMPTTPPAKGKGAPIAKGKGKGYTDPPYSKGKGKGKGYTDPPYSKGKGKGKGYTDPPYSKGKGKGYTNPPYSKGGKGGKGSKSSKSGKKSKHDPPPYSKGKGYYPPYSKGKGVPTDPPMQHTSAPTAGSGSMDEPTASPMTSVSQQGLVSPAPTPQGDSVQMDEFEIIFSGRSTDPPTDAQLTQLETTTELFLDDFFEQGFSQSSSFDYSETITYRSGGTADAPRFISTIHFNFGSPTPPKDDLQDAVAFAFTNAADRAAYIIDVRSIHGSPYTQVTGVEFQWVSSSGAATPPTDAPTDSPTDSPTPSPVSPPTDPPVQQSQEQGVEETEVGSSSSSSSDSTTAGASAGAAGAGVFALMIGGLIIVRRRRQRDEISSGKFLDENDGHVTVAGETYAGETYMGSSLGENYTNYTDPLQKQTPVQGAYSYNPSKSSSSTSSSSHGNGNGSVSDSASVGSADWDQFQRSPGQDADPGMSPKQWGEITNALSAGRPPSPPPPEDPWSANRLSNVMEDDAEYDLDESHAEDDSSSDEEPVGHMEDVRL